MLLKGSCFVPLGPELQQQAASSDKSLDGLNSAVREEKRRKLLVKLRSLDHQSRKWL